MLDSMKTPSYPSGHEVQGYLIGEILSKHDPQNSHIYHQLGEDIALFENYQTHYPSDKKYGKILSRVLFKGLK